MILKWNISGHIVEIDLVDLIPALKKEWVVVDGIVTGLGGEFLHETIALDMGLLPIDTTIFMDGNPFNLSRENIGKVSQADRKGYSNFPGVSFDVSRGKWVCQVKRGELSHYSRHTTEFQAYSVCKQFQTDIKAGPD